MEEATMPENIAEIETTEEYLARASYNLDRRWAEVVAAHAEATSAAATEPSPASTPLFAALRNRPLVSIRTGRHAGPS